MGMNKSFSLAGSLFPFKYTFVELSLSAILSFRFNPLSIPSFKERFGILSTVETLNGVQQENELHRLGTVSLGYPRKVATGTRDVRKVFRIKQ